MDRLQSMRVFAKVVDEGGFSAASRALDMSAPMVTRLVADLEDDLGTRLLQRTTRKVTLTDAGQTFLERVRTILADIDEVYDVVATSTGSLRGRLRVQAAPVLANHLLAPHLPAFMDLHPGLSVELEVSNLGLRWVEDFDLTLVVADEHFDANIVARKLFETQVVLVASPGYLGAHAPLHTASDLQAHRLLQIRLAPWNPRLLKLTHEADPAQNQELSVTPALLASTLDTLLAATLGGGGIAPAPIHLLGEHLSSGRLVRVLAPWHVGRSTVYAALPSRKFIPRRTHALLDFLSATVQAQAAGAWAFSASP